MPNQNSHHVDFFINQTTNGKSPALKPQILAVGLFASGVFDGAVLRIEVSPDALLEDEDQMTWFDHPDGTFTDATVDEVHYWSNANLAETYMRAVITDAGENTSLTFKMRPRTQAVI